MVEKKENMESKKSEKQKKISITDKAVLHARGEALIVMGALTCGISILLAIYALAIGQSVFPYLTIAVLYLAGASLYSYRYQKTKGFLMFGIIGIVLAVLCFFMYCIL